MKYTLRSAVSILLLTQALGYVSSSYAGADNLAAIERAFNTKDNRYLQVLIKQSSGFDSFIAQYRLAMSYQIKQDIDNSKKVLEQLLNSLVPYTENNPADMEAKALLANVYGLSIALNPSKAESYGPLSFSLIEQALKQAPHKPIVLFFKASLSYYTPTMYGGSKVKAHATLKKALNAYSGNSRLGQLPVAVT